MTSPYRSPLDAELYIPDKLAYLDLASGLEDKTANSPELMSKNIPSAAGYLDLALFRSTILVTNGQIQEFSRLMLKRQGSCGKFVLFPNLPKELQSQVFKHCSDAEPRRIRFMEMDDNGFRSMKIIGARRPVIFAASRDALLDAFATKRYLPLFATVENNTKLYFRRAHDWAQLGVLGLPCAPKVDLAAALVNKLDLSSVQTLQMTHDDILITHAWSRKNLPYLPNIKLLLITAQFADPGRAELGFCSLYFQEVSGTREAFMPYCVAPDGDQAEYRGAFDAMDRYICHVPEKLRIRDFNACLHAFLKDVPNFPLLVRFLINYVPVPGHPLATIQPLVQPR
ncbi:uncharacterized protein RSE6_00689 [Rhynchosporium secalis]|uniref:2EXR domain-containing protein n=1 Tax=Rhynchosporium secalis TaxID=38038 RepID=A0A1E1LVZ7_RHYSE|nr:uncharacterized protein RSE6_00689 [Rhynchosporium secalis]